MDSIIVGKASIAVVLCIFAFACLRHCQDPRVFDWTRPRLIALFLLLRIGAYVGCFLVLRIDARSDVVIYVDLARYVLEGNIPGKTELVPLHYGPLFLYVIAGVLMLWNDAKAIVLFTVLCELVSFVIWLRVSDRLFARATTVRAAILYACAPISIFSGVIAGNNDVLAGLFVTLGVMFLAGGCSKWSGAMLGVSVVVSKALTILSGLPLFLAAGNKPAWLAWAALPVVTIYSLWVLLSVDILAGFRFHGAHYSSGNLPFLLGLFGLGDNAHRVRTVVNAVGALLVLGVAGLPILRLRSLSLVEAVFLLAAAHILFLLVSAKSFPHYAAIVLFPIMISFARHRDQRRLFMLYCLYNLATSVESSMWFRWFQNGSPAQVNAMMSASFAHYVTFVAVEILMLASYAAMAWCFVSVYFATARANASDRLDA